MRKKRLAASLLALSVCFSLAACSGGSSNSPAPESQAPETTAPASSASDESDLAYIQDKGTLVVGITDFAPMDYKEAGSDEWIGFDADMAKAFAESLGVEVEFTEITWDYKVMELESKSIDVVWNGMTLNDEVMAAMGTSVPYCTNYQVLVYPADKAADFEGLTSLEGLNVAVESGSAGEDAAEALGATTVPVQSQANTLMEVSAGTSDAAVIDVLMAAATTGEGTSYADLVYSLNLNDAQGLASEEYGVGFRKGSDMVDAFNEFWASAVADGTVQETAATYGLQDAVILE
ncbi:transporter substrate-binding domain-containing protein [Intestinimonas butyriciproducens]|uniref:transporter substrate-binding domain-containing protein n=1 Tax=Intestinimonas butyriciproducens TaxID=1297617 RepID=UPI00195BE460|nr:transporter substrate-binding domain-containing protein [Intestinimonas butyriciproducens]MBM6976774.1 transporter substrate-binding domain-containing protein [Intestinimonas butyriciproducens]